MTTVYHISTLTSPADFTAGLTVGHMENLRDRIIETLGREDINVFIDADDGGDVPTDLSENVSDRLINIHICYKDADTDEVTEKGVWDILLAVPHEDNMWSEWSNSYLLQVVDIDTDMLEEVSIENGNPRMYETIAERVNYWLPKL